MTGHFSPTTVIPMAASVSDHDSESSLSESLGTKTLQARFIDSGDRQAEYRVSR